VLALLLLILLKGVNTFCSVPLNLTEFLFTIYENLAGCWIGS